MNSVIEPQPLEIVPTLSQDAQRKIRIHSQSHGRSSLFLLVLLACYSSNATHVEPSNSTEFLSVLVSYWESAMNFKC